MEADRRGQDQRSLFVACQDLGRQSLGLLDVARTGGLPLGARSRQKLDQTGQGLAVPRVGLEVAIQDVDRGGTPASRLLDVGQDVIGVNDSWALP